MQFADDELVAIAIAAGHGWPGRLPTVSDADAEALLDSLRRGRVTLAVRGLSDAEDLEDTVVARVREAAGLRPVVRSYVMAEEQVDTAVGLATEVYRLADGNLLVDVSRPDGLHEIEVAGAARVRAFLDRAADMALEEGVGVEGLRLAVIASDGDDIQAQLVDRGRVSRGWVELAKDGTTFVGSDESTTLDRSVIDRLLATT